MERKLKIELIPDGCWGYNLRDILSARQWDYIRKDAKKRAGDKCSVCGKKCAALQAHERWDYDEKNGVLILSDVVALCPDCHSAVHMERTRLKGDIVKAEEHYMKVNGCSYAEYRKDLGEANALQARRNKVPEWKIDLSWLKRFIDE